MTHWSWACLLLDNHLVRSRKKIVRMAWTLAGILGWGTPGEAKVVSHPDKKNDYPTLTHNNHFVEPKNTRIIFFCNRKSNAPCQC